MSRPKKFLRALQDNVRERGAMKQLLVDSANVECSEKVMDYLGMLVIEFWQSEPWQQHQQPSERRWQTVKRVANRLLNFTGAPPKCWLLACEYVCFVLNHCATPFLNFQVPLQMLTGQVVDISPMLAFSFWEPVYYKVDDSSFPSENTEKRGRFVGVAENVGHFMTFRILTDDSSCIINRSNVRTALDNASRNKALEDLDLADIWSGPEPEDPIIYNRYNDDIASDDGEKNKFDDYTEAVSDSDDTGPLTGTSRTYRRMSPRLAEKRSWEQAAQKQSTAAPSATKIARDSVRNLNQLSKNSSNASHIIRFPLGTRVEKKFKGEPIMGFITAYDLKQDLYTIQYTNLQQESISHKDVILI